MSLTDEINVFVSNFKSNAPQEAKDLMQEAQRELKKNGLGLKSKRAGDSFADFELPNHLGDLETLDSLLKKNKFLVVSFYRGGWCPYCNLELKALERERAAFNELGAELIAITPESPDSVSDTRTKNEVNFPVLTDADCLVARDLGLSFELPEIIRPLYKQFGIDVEAHNGEGKYTLPIPATYIIDSNKEIVFDFVDVDYTNRLDPLDVVKTLKTLQES